MARSGSVYCVETGPGGPGIQARQYYLPKPPLSIPYPLPPWGGRNQCICFTVGLSLDTAP
jgi:hypothetical protein